MTAPRWLAVLVASLCLAISGWTRRRSSAGRLPAVTYGVASPVLLVGALVT